MSIDRRTFMKTLAGAGALVAVSELPSFAKDEPEIFPDRGGHERLSLSYAVVKLGLERPFSILHVSDTHLTAAYADESEKKQTLHTRRTQTFGGMQELALRNTIEWAKEHVDYIVHTGDLIDWQSQANYDLVKKYFGENMTGSMGNHEYSPDMWLSEPAITNDEKFKDLFRETLQNVYPFDILFCSQIVNGVNFITIDDVFGYVIKEQVERFKEEVKKGLPIVLCMHVPFFTDEIWRVTQRFWGKTERYKDSSIPEPSGDYKRQKEDKVTRKFIEYLKKEPLLKAILAGHEHLTFQDQFSPTATEYLISGNFLFAGREVLFI